MSTFIPFLGNFADNADGFSVFIPVKNATSQLMENADIRIPVAVVAMVKIFSQIQTITAAGMEMCRHIPFKLKD